MLFCENFGEWQVRVASGEWKKKGGWQFFTCHLPLALATNPATRLRLGGAGMLGRRSKLGCRGFWRYSAQIWEVASGLWPVEEKTGYIFSLATLHICMKRPVADSRILMGTRHALIGYHVRMKARAWQPS
jgi:hypothetical protein